MHMAANVEAMVREGTNALKAGRKEEARALLMKAVELDELNEDAWLWLSAVVETEEDQQTCLENVLAINPTNERARQGLKYLEQQRSGGAPAVNISPAPSPAPPPVYAPPPATSTSVEWGLPNEEPARPAAAAQRAPDLSEEDYDNWVSTLNLPTSSKSMTATSSAPTPFVSDDEEDFDDPSFELDLPPLPDKSKPSKADAKRKSNSPIPEVDDDFDLDKLADDAGERKGGVKLPAMPKFGLPAMPKREKKENPPKPEKAPPEPVEPIFDEIPEEIRATRMPGTQERLSPLVILLLIVVLAANIAMGVLLAQTFIPG
jgi:hypothetical protein